MFYNLYPIKLIQRYINPTKLIQIMSLVLKRYIGVIVFIKSSDSRKIKNKVP